jgi:hypothetical protein
MVKKQNKKQVRIKQKSTESYTLSEKHQRYYAFGFLVGDY